MPNKAAPKKTSRRVKRLRCSFCRRDDRKVSKLVGGPDAFICEDCVGLCNRILADESVSRWAWLTDGDLLETLPASQSGARGLARSAAHPGEPAA